MTRQLLCLEIKRPKMISQLLCLELTKYDQSTSLPRNKKRKKMTNQCLCWETKKWTKMTNQLFCWEMTKNDQAMYLPRNEKWPKMTGQLLYLVFFFFQCINQMIWLIHSLHFQQVHMLFLLHLLWKTPFKFLSYHSLSSSSTSFVFNFENHSWHIFTLTDSLLQVSVSYCLTLAALVPFYNKV